MVRTIACVMLAGLTAASCTDPGPTIGAADAVPDGAVEVPFEDLAAGFNTGFVDGGRLVIRSPAELDEFWSTFEAPRDPKTDPPSVDFDRSIVIAAAMGQRGTGGHAVTILAVHELEGTLYVTVRELSPGPGCMTTMGMTQPVFAVSAQSSDADVVFVERTETTICE